MSDPSDSSPEASASPSSGALDVSPGGSGTPDPAPATPPPALPDDLPPQLVQQGWRKFWSKRENRPYFWNKLSGESMWELPPIKTEFDPLTDPLGICHNSAVIVNSSTPSKRRSSEESGPPPKKFVVSGPWDLEITTNVVICERLHSQYLHPHPEIEALRFTLTNKLRQCFQELCHARESIDAPKDAFNRWLMERKVNEQNGIDPLLPSNCYPEVSHSLYEEIMNDIPIKICQPKFTGDARKQLSRYAEAAKKMIESRNASPESRKVVKWNAEDTFQWLRKTVGATYDDFQDRLEHLKKQCQPHLAETVKGSVEGICLKLYHLSCEYARKINERHLRLLSEHGLEPPQMPPLQEALSERRVWSSPCMPRGPLPPRPPHLEQYVDRELAIIKHHNEPVAIHHLYLQKLEWLYRVWGGGAGSGAAWSPSRAFCVARRYLAYCGPSTTTSPLLSLPAAVLHSMHHHFHVTFECFSTPFTSFYRQYCSPFPDTDGYYGSIGPWCESRVCSGSMVALLPGPGCGEAGEAAARHCEVLLEAAESGGAALALVVVVRECEEGAGRSSLAAFLRSRHRRRHLTLPPPSHYYVAHHLHHPPTAPHLHHPAQPSALLWLQTTAAYARTPPTDDRVDALLDAWRVPAAAPAPAPTPSPAPAPITTTVPPPHALQQAAVAPNNVPAAVPSPAPAPVPTTPTLSPASAIPLLSPVPTSNIATTTQNHLPVNTTTCT